eukprot:3958399-Amphidinium_carterae.1
MRCSKSCNMTRLHLERSHAETQSKRVNLSPQELGRAPRLERKIFNHIGEKALWSGISLRTCTTTVPHLSKLKRKQMSC